MKETMEDLCKKVAEEVTPTKKERGEVQRLLMRFIRKASGEARLRGLRVKVEVEGSIAKDTWIRADRDLDIFLIFPKGTARDMLGRDGLDVAKASAGSTWKLGYAEHPYVEAEIEGFKLDIVPSVEMAKGEKPTTAVDRTPLHTRFVRRRLNSTSRSEVRILKQFLKGVGVYGAELKVGGFSGYLAELLVIHYGSFESAIKAAATWKERTFIDMIGRYGGKDLGGIFEGCLVVVDPIDMARNVAAAVSVQSYFTFIAAARSFLKDPNIRYFFPRERRVGANDIMDEMAKKRTHLVALATSCPRIPSDILWGEAYRSMRKIASVLEEGGFALNDMATWTDEEKKLFFFFELYDLELSRGRLHLGPRVTLIPESERFLEKYRKGRKVLAGPYIRDDRWVVELERDYSSALALLAAKLREISLSRDIAGEVSKGHGILVDDQLREHVDRVPALAGFLLQFLRKRPPWLNP